MDLSCWLVLVDIMVQILLHNDPHNALRLCPLLGTKKVKSDVAGDWMGNHECHGCVCVVNIALATMFSTV